jgi:DNA-binding transcriptional MerR regulator
VDETWTFHELVSEAARRISALPPPKNGQVRAVPDERTIRYYAAIGLLDRPAAMRGRTALYSARHLAQVVAIKRMQSAGKTLAEIRDAWATLDDQTLARMSGIALPKKPRAAARAEFWKREPAPSVSPPPPPAPVMAAPELDVPQAVEMRIAIAPNVHIAVAVEDAISLSPADVRALRAAAASLVAELAKRGLTARGPGTLEES